jgi:hypothetical protein
MNVKDYATKKFVMCPCGRFEWRKWKDLGEINGKLKEKLEQIMDSHGICSKCFKLWFEQFKFKEIYYYDFYLLQKNEKKTLVDDPSQVIRMLRKGWVLQRGIKRYEYTSFIR